MLSSPLTLTPATKWGNLPKGWFLQNLAKLSAECDSLFCTLSLNNLLLQT